MAQPGYGTTLEQTIPVVQEQGLNTTKNTNLGGTLNVEGAVTLASTLTVAGTVISSGILVGSTNTLTGSGAVSVTTVTTKLNTTGGGTYTLANGTDGQIKIIVLTVDSGTDAVITPTTKTGFSTITLGDAGDGVILVYTTTTGWICVANQGGALG